MTHRNSLDRPRLGTVSPTSDGDAQQREQTLEGLIDRLPPALRAAIRWLRRPSVRWVRLLGGILLVGGSLLSLLPLFGLWMLPLGVMLLAEDVPPLRRVRDRVLDRIARRQAQEMRGPRPEDEAERRHPRDG